MIPWWLWAAGAAVLVPAVAMVGRDYRKGVPIRAPGELRDLLARVEATGSLPGITTFGMAVALRESGYNRMAHNPDDAKAASRLLDGARSRGFYEENPTISDPAWRSGSGGWFGMLPATGLSAGGKRGPFSRSSPRLIHEPVPSVVMFADLMARLILYHLPVLPSALRTFLAVRRGMASTELVADASETYERSRDVHARLVKDLGRCCDQSAWEAERFAGSQARVGNYQGAAWLLARLTEGEPSA